MSTFSEIHELEEKVTAIRNALYDKITHLPDNPRINRLGRNVFTMNASDLQNGGSLSPEYYDFARVYGKLADWITGLDINRVIPQLQQAVDKGVFKFQGEKIRLH